MKRQSIALVWFRQDLRLTDNPALTQAAAEHSHILPLYVYDPNDAYLLGGAQQWWLHHSLSALEKNLAEHALRLCLRKGSPAAIIEQLCEELSISAVYWNRCYEPLHIERDKAIKATLRDKNISVTTSNGSLLNEPWTIFNKSGAFFKVFTPYWRHCLQHTVVTQPQTIPTWPENSSAPSDALSDWQLLPSAPNWASEFGDVWQPGELGALERLEQFVSEDIARYRESRDIPASNSTSHLSPHLHFGEVSPWQIWRLVEEAKKNPECNVQAANTFLSEIGWREFSYYLLYHFPELPSKNFKEKFDGFAWENDKYALRQWQRGLTGYPIVDAGMRQLWKTGFMHNRVRMIVASFLIKDLLVDWREGAQWFWDTLVDADLASNCASWQWVAGCGADASPYFRIFNPVLQGEKFDPQGLYVKQWVPELRPVTTAAIHKPWLATTQELGGLRLGTDYPKPLVDHAKAREYALGLYKTLSHPKENQE